MHSISVTIDLRLIDMVLYCLVFSRNALLSESIDMNLLLGLIWSIAVGLTLALLVLAWLMQ